MKKSDCAFVRNLARPPGCAQRAPPALSTSVVAEPNVTQNVGGNMKKAKDFTAGETVVDRGRRFIIERIVTIPATDQIAFVDTDGGWHGLYSPEEYLGFEGVDDDGN